MTEDVESSSGTERHVISARVRAHHYTDFEDPEDIPGGSDERELVSLTNFNIVNVGFECTCGERFLFGRTAREHLREVQTETQQQE